ncbi:Vacuolar protein sorting-associated protein 16 [Tritrichomonas musculus]|uniref:Vacuolar protein sorting-associated protein 16 n=1 Tax=Tritrichomonas musculus TaxID=1915356 RepID=A0ABR2K9I9_9EUKA
MEYLIGKEDISDTSIVDISKDWRVYGDTCLSWRKLWDLDSTLYFGNDAEEKFSGGNDGTLIARYRKPDISYHAKSIEIYDYKGNKIYEYQIKDANDLFFHVTKEDRLIVLTSNGCLMTFFAGREVSKVQICDQDKNILKAELWDEGLVFINQDFDLFYMQFTEKPQLLHNIKNYCQMIDKMKIVPPNDTRQLTIFITNASDKIFVINEHDIEEVILEPDSFIANFSINSCCSHIAFLINSLDDTKILVTEIDPKNILVNTYLEQRNEVMQQLSWAGSSVPIISYEDSVNILCNDFHIYEMSNGRYPFSGRSWVFPSSNYSLIFSSGALFILKEISDNLFDALRSDIKTSSMNLVNAFLKRSSEKALMMKKEGTLRNAVDMTISAAFDIDSPQVQQLFMFAANFGRTYLDLSNGSEAFSDDIQKLRICNSFVKELNIFISPLNLYDITSSRSLLSRICNRKRFSLALKIADFLKSYDKQFIVTEWCLAMAYENQDDENALKFISAKYSKNEELFEINAIATALSKEGRLNLAKKVAGLDKASMNVVPFFISCGMWEEALVAAQNSYDSTLFVECFNKAIDNKLDDTVLNIVKNHKTMLKTIAKLIPSDPETINHIQNIKSGNDEELSLIIKRNKTYIRVISENSSSFLPPNIFNYVKGQQMSANQFQVDWKQPLGDRTINKALEEIILSIDYTSVSNITDFIKKCSHSTNFLTKKFGSHDDKYYIMIATVLAKHKKWVEFCALTDNAFKNYYHNYVMIALYNFGYDHAIEFIQKIHDTGRAKKLEELLKNPDQTSQFVEYLDKNPKTFHYFK